MIAVAMLAGTMTFRPPRTTSFRTHCQFAVLHVRRKFPFRSGAIGTRTSVRNIAIRAGSLFLLPIRVGIFLLHLGSLLRGLALGEFLGLRDVDGVASTNLAHQTLQTLRTLGRELVGRDFAISVLVELLEPLDHLAGFAAFAAGRSARFVLGHLSHGREQLIATQLFFPRLLESLVEQFAEFGRRFRRDLTLLELPILVGVHPLEHLTGIGTPFLTGRPTDFRFGVGFVCGFPLFLRERFVLVFIPLAEQSIQMRTVLFRHLLGRDLAVLVSVELVEQLGRVLSLSCQSASCTAHRKQSPAGPAKCSHDRSPVRQKRNPRV